MADEPGASAKPGSMNVFARSALAALVVCGTVGPALADDKTDLQSKISTALKAAKSFTTMAVVTASGVVISSTVVAPDRAKTSIAAGTMTMDSVLIGTDFYTSRNGSPYVKSAAPPQVVAQLQSATELPVASILPDVSEAGVVSGAFTTTIPGAAAPITLACEYDKRTFRPTKCANDQYSVTYADFNDPKNVVEPPKDAK